jgi:hypothetical protein
MQWKVTALALALSVQDARAASASSLMSRQYAQAAMMRFQCSQLVFDRIDPLVQPGMTPSAHMHQVSFSPYRTGRVLIYTQIVGGDSFNVTMKQVDYDPSTKSSCTTCVG